MTQAQARSRTPRAERFPITLVVRVDSPRGSMSATTLNVSLGGMQLRAELASTARVGDRIEVEFELPGLVEPVRVSAEVRWVARDDGSVGVHFVRGLRPREVWALTRLAQASARLGPSEILGDWGR